MALSENLYALRKGRGLSQEQLAEQLGVSRQAVSKWESGQAVPEMENLLLLSRFFGVSLDALVQDGGEGDTLSAVDRGGSKPGKRLAGIVLCLGGAIALLVWGLIAIWNPSALNPVRESSWIHLDGAGIFLILCAAAMVGGFVLLLKNAAKK